MRCYNGCPDSQLQRLLDNCEDLMKSIKKIEPEAHCTYCYPFPGYNHGYSLCVWGKEIVFYKSEKGLQSKIMCLQLGLNVLKGKFSSENQS